MPSAPLPHEQTVAADDEQRHGHEARNEEHVVRDHEDQKRRPGRSALHAHDAQPCGGRIVAPHEPDASVFWARDQRGKRAEGDGEPTDGAP